LHSIECSGACRAIVEGCLWRIPLRQEGVVAIPKTATSDRVRENHAALGLELTERDLADLDRAFLSPTGPRPLEML